MKLDFLPRCVKWLYESRRDAEHSTNEATDLLDALRRQIDEEDDDLVESLSVLSAVCQSSAASDLLLRLGLLHTLKDILLRAFDFEEEEFSQNIMRGVLEIVASVLIATRGAAAQSVRSSGFLFRGLTLLLLLHKQIRFSYRDFLSVTYPVSE